MANCIGEEEMVAKKTLGLVFLLAACATPPLSPFYQEEQTRYQEIQRLYANANYSQAHSKTEIFLKRFPQSSVAWKLENLDGLILMQMRAPEQAALQFQKAAKTAPKPEKNSVLYHLALAQFQIRAFQQSEKTLESITFASLSPEQQLPYFLLKASLAEQQSHFLEAITLFLETSCISDLPRGNFINLYRKVEQNFAHLSERPISDTYNFLNHYQKAPIFDVVLFELGTQALEKTPQDPAGESYLQRLLTEYPQSAYAERASQKLTQKPLPQEPQPTEELNYHAIGVLLPTTGNMGKYSNKLLQAIKLGLEGSFEIILEESGQSPEQATQALENLVKKHKVPVVLGPLLTKGVDAIAERAQALGMPLISLARKATLLSSQPDSFIFEAGLTQKMQATEIAKYALERLQLKKFAILYPQEKLGIQATEAFWDTVELLGGSIVGVESYTPSETDFRQIVDKISGLYYTDARKNELDALSQERTTNNIKKRTRKTEKFYQLKPIVDYQAVFLPDEASVASQIMPMFAYRDIESVTFLGMASWNTPQLVQRAGPSSDGAHFVDFWLENPNLEKIKGWDHRPDTLEILAYDAAELLKKTLRQLPPKYSRLELKQKLQSLPETQGLTEKILMKDHHFHHPLTLMRIQKGNIIPTSTNHP